MAKKLPSVLLSTMVTLTIICLLPPNLKNVEGAERSGSSDTLFDNQVTIVVADKWGGKKVTAIRGTKGIPSIVKDNNLLIDMFPNDKISLIFK